MHHVPRYREPEITTSGGRHCMCRRCRLIVRLLFIGLPFECQAAVTPGWSWAFAGNAQTLADVNAVACPGDGSSFAAGTFARNIVLGHLQLTAPDINGTWQGFAAKFDLSGRGVWAVAMTATNGIIPMGLASDGAGGCFVAGGFVGNAVLGGLTLSGGTGFRVFVAPASCCSRT